MTVELILEVLVGSIAASGGLMAMVPKLLAWWRRQKMAKTLRDVKTTYGALNRILTDLNANRVSVTELCNGGSTPRPGKPMYVRSVYEINAVPTPAGRAIWTQKTEADPVSVEILADLATTRDALSFVTEDLGEGQLRLIAEAMDSDKIVVVRIGCDGKRLMALTVMLPDDGELTPMEELLLRETAKSLENLLL